MRTCLALLLVFVGIVYAKPELQSVLFKDVPVLGITAKVNPKNASQSTKTEIVYFGGFTGIHYEGADPSKRGHLFRVSAGRGPTAEPVNFVPDTHSSARPFVLPEFVPSILTFLVDFKGNTASLVSDVPLYRGDGTNLTGLPNIQYQAQGLAYTDEYGVDLFGNVQVNDPLGANLGGIVRNYDDNSFWLADEYRASVYHFDSNGKLLKRYIPQGLPTQVGYGVPELPAVYAQRRNNRGFKGIALEGDTLYAFLESPLDNPNRMDNNVSIHSLNVRILAFNVLKEVVAAEFVYVLHAAGNTIGDVASLGGGRFLVLEQDDRADKSAFKCIFEISINGATDVSGDKVDSLLPPNTTLEQVVLDPKIAIKPVSKAFIENLAALGFAYDNIDGIAIFDANSVVVVNNNNYQIATTPINGNGTVAFDRSRNSYFGLVTGLNFTSSSTTFNPTTTATSSATTGTSGSSTTGGSSTSGFTTHATSTSSTTTGHHNTTTTGTDAAGLLNIPVVFIVGMLFLCVTMFW